MIEQHMNDSNAGERVRNGVQVSIVGKPNVGKSTLLNVLCRRSAAIVSPIAGTTRDAIEQHIDIEGYPVRLIDTAGLRDSKQADAIEVEGMKRTNEAASSSDLIICLKSADEISLDSLNTLNNEVFKELEIHNDKAIKLIVINKSDLLSKENLLRVSEKLKLSKSVCLMSCSTRAGLNNFTELLGHYVRQICTRDEGKQIINSIKIWYKRIGRTMSFFFINFSPSFFSVPPTCRSDISRSLMYSETSSIIDMIIIIVLTRYGKYS